jgi:hypothetical protein
MRPGGELSEGLTMDALCDRLRGRIVWIAIIVLGLGGGAVYADAPALQISWSLDGGPPNMALPAGAPAGGNAYAYAGVLVDDATGLELDYDLTADATSLLNGNLSILNDLAEAIEVSIEVVLPTDAPHPTSSLLAGQGLVGLTTGVGGGQISALPPHLWQALSDGNTVGVPATMFADPFTLAHPGPSSSGTSADFGSPEPVPGPPVTTSFGFKLAFALTAGDRASVTSTLVVGALPCPGDLDGDGFVAIGDVIEVLALWGPCPPDPDPCPGDIDGDGDVGITDFLELLALWGPCP